MSAIEVGAVRASASLETASFEAGTARARKALSYLGAGFEQTTREAVRQAEGMSRAWDDGFSKTAMAAQKQLDALLGVERASRDASATGKRWASELDRQAKSFDRLRASIDPVFAASKSYESAVERAENAVRSGIVSQTEANRVLDQAAQKYLGLVPAAEQAAQAEKEAALAAQTARKSYEQTRASLDPLYAASKKYETAVEQMTAAVKVGSVSQMEANKVLQLAEQRYLGVGGSTQKATAPTRGFMSLFSKERSHDLRNIAMQLSQVGQQGSVTGDYLGAAAIQASDIGVAFGVAGIAVGALVSVLGPMAIELFSNSEEAKTLEDRMADLSGAVSDLTGVSEIARDSLADLRTSYGDNAEAVRELYRELITLNQQQALNAVDESIRQAAGGLSEFETALGSFSDARRELLRLQDQVSESPFGPLPSEMRRLKELVEEASDDIQEQFGLTTAQAYRIRDALDEVNTAATHEGAIEAARNLASAIASAADEGSQLPPEFAEIANATGVAFREASKIEQEVQRSADAATRLAHVSGLINFNGAAASAKELAEWLNISLVTALELAATTPMMADEDLLMSQSVIPDAAAREGHRAAIKNYERLTKSLDGVASSSGKATKALDNELKAIKASLNPMEAYNEELEKLAKYQGELDPDLMARAMRNLNVELADSLPLVGDLADGFTDDLFGGFKDGLSGTLDAFKNWLKNLAAEALKNQIVISLGLSGGGAAGGLAQAGAGLIGGGSGGAGGGVGGAGGLIGNLGGALLGGGGGIAGAFGTGLASSIGGFASGGLAGGFGAIGAQLSATAAGGFGLSSVAASLGAVAVPLAAVALVVSFLSTKTKHLDNGLRVTADNMGVLVEEFDKVQKSKFWGLSKKVSVTFKDADEATSSAITDTIDGITGAIFSAGEQLGLTADHFSSWSTQIQVSLKGLDEAERDAELQRIFDTVAEQFSYAALGSFNDVMGGALIRDGETATDTLNALVVSLQAANNGLGLVNAALFDTSVMGANMARSLTDAFGGVDNFNAAVNGYFTAFYTQEEQLAVRTGRLADQFDALNVAMPTTRDGLRDMVEAQDLNTAGGRDLYAGLVLLSGEFAALSSLSEQLYGSAVLASGGVAQLVRSLASGVVGAENELASAQQAAMAEYNNVLRIMDVQIGAARTARDSIKSIFDILSDGLDSRSLLDQEAEKLRRQNLQTELAGGISDPQRLRKVIQGLNEPSEQFFGSYVDYAQDYARTSALMSQQKGVAEDQLTEAEKQLLALRDQKTAIQNLYGPLLGIDSNTDNLEEALERLDLTMKSVEAATSRMEDAMYALANAMLAAISGIGGTGGLMGMGADAFSAFSFDRTNGIFSEEAAGALDGIAGQINGIYQDVFGRNADVAGLEFYGNLLQGGDIKAGRVAYDLMTSGEANTGVTPGFGNIGSAAQPVDPVEALYGSMLGRPADAAGVEFWKSTGLEGDALVNAFRDASLAAGEAPSFDGGGYTGNGSRTGGVDGLGGFWSLLHPQETVIDHTRGGPFGFGGVGAPPASAGGYRPSSAGRSDNSSAQLTQVVAELKRANDRLARLEKQNKESATYAKRSSEVLERVDALGVETRPAT